MSIMARYLALIFFLSAVNCDKNEERAKAVNEILNNPQLLAPLETDTMKLLAGFRKIPQPLVENSVEFFDKMMPQVKSLPADNLVRKHTEDLAVLNTFYRDTVDRPLTTVLKVFGSIYEFAKNAAEVRNAASSSSQQELANLYLKSLKVVDPKWIKEFKSYVDETLKKSKELNVTPDHELVKYLSQMKVLFAIFEVTGGNEPSKNILKANPWITSATDAVFPKLSQYIAWKKACANLVRSIN